MGAWQAAGARRPPSANVSAVVLAEDGGLAIDGAISGTAVGVTSRAAATGELRPISRKESQATGEVRTGGPISATPMRRASLGRVAQAAIAARSVGLRSPLAALGLGSVGSSVAVLTVVQSIGRRPAITSGPMAAGTLGTAAFAEGEGSTVSPSV